MSVNFAFFRDSDEPIYLLFDFDAQTGCFKKGVEYKMDRYFTEVNAALHRLAVVTGHAVASVIYIGENKGKRMMQDLTTGMIIKAKFELVPSPIDQSGIPAACRRKKFKPS